MHVLMNVALTLMTFCSLVFCLCVVALNVPYIRKQLNHQVVALLPTRLIVFLVLDLVGSVILTVQVFLFDFPVSRPDQLTALVAILFTWLVYYVTEKVLRHSPKVHV